MTSSGPVALLGAGGTMGFPMARNVLGAGIELRAWNRTRGRAAPLEDDGAAVVDSPAEAAEGTPVIVTMLADTDAVVESMDGAEGGLAGAQDGALWLQMSTIGERGTERCAELAAEHGVGFVDAPVLGTKQPAQDGALIVLASGPDDARERAQPIFDAVGRKTLWVGEAGRGTQLKLVTNAWIVAVTEGGAEAIALAEGLGIDPSLFFEAIDGGPLDLPYLRIKGEMIAKREFEPSFSLRLAAKDAALVEEAAAGRDLDLPLVAAVRRRLEEGAREHGDEDMSATYLTSAPG
jgi:3-hydroxyisobutyrate dehydrogenase